jgi:hypothetical protein
MTEPVPSVPVLDGEPWHITGYPDLGELAYLKNHEVVDHAIWQSQDGKWHVWACVRGTRVGRVLYGWEGASLEQPDWTPVGVTMRVDRSYGESINDWSGEEWIQAPFVLQHPGGYAMLYGGHNTELGECQVCLAESADGRTFTRHSGANGFSRVFVGPGEARDPMVLRIGEEWVCYYCGHDTGLRAPCKVYARSSPDLVHWSAAREVAWGGFASGTGFWSTECPFVVYRDGYYYLFRTSEYVSPARTHVYRSLDPFDFGLGTDTKLVTTLRLAAPEIVSVGGQDYVSSVEDLKGGIQLFKLKWI